MQTPSLPSVTFEKLLLGSADKSLLVGDIVATNLDDAILLENKIQKLPSVADIDPPVDMLENFIQSNQVKKLPLIHSIKDVVKPLNFSAPDTQPVNLSDL